MYEFIDYQVRDVMTSEPITVKQDITFEDNSNPRARLNNIDENY